MADNDPPPPRGPLDDFLHPQSMVTPGVLGCVAMVGTNFLCANFTNFNPPVVSLVLSFLFGLVTIIMDTPLVQRVGYYVLNSMIIFIVAVGANTVGLAIQPPAKIDIVGRSSPSIHFQSISAAYANEGQSSLSHTQMAGGFFRPWSPPEQRKVQPSAPPTESNQPNSHTGPANPSDHHTGNPPSQTAPSSPHH